MEKKWAEDVRDNKQARNFSNSNVREMLAPGYTTAFTLATGFNHPDGIAVDAFGNVFAADTNNNLVKVIVE